MIKKWKAKITMANRELRGVRIPLFRLVSSVLALVLSMVSIFTASAGFFNAGLVMAMFAVASVSIAVGLSAINALRTIIPVLKRTK